MQLQTDFSIEKIFFNSRESLKEIRIKYGIISHAKGSFYNKNLIFWKVIVRTVISSSTF